MKRDGEIRNVHLPIQLGVWELLLALTLMGLLNIFNDNGKNVFVPAKPLFRLGSRHKTPTEHHTTLTACKCDREKTRKREASTQLSNLFSPCLAWRGGGSRQPGGPLLEAEAEAASQRSPHPSRTPETDGREETQTSSASLPSPPSSLSAPNLKESLSAGRPISINLSPSQLSSVTPDMRGSDLSSPSASLPLLDVGGGLPCHVEHNATMQSARGEGGQQGKMHQRHFQRLSWLKMHFHENEEDEANALLLCVLQFNVAQCRRR